MTFLRLTLSKVQLAPEAKPMRQAQRIDQSADVLRPFAWVAMTSFSAGFWGYVVLAPFLRP